MTYPSNLGRKLDLSLAYDSFIVSYVIDEVIHLPYDKLIMLFFSLGISVAAYTASLGKRAVKKVFTNKHIRDLDKTQPGRLIKSIKR